MEEERHRIIKVKGGDNYVFSKIDDENYTLKKVSEIKKEAIEFLQYMRSMIKRLQDE